MLSSETHDRDEAAQALLEALRRVVPGERVISDPDLLAGLSQDEAEWAPVGSASAALCPRTEAEVQAAVRVCADLRVPLVSRGAGTGLSGGANAVDGCLLLDLSRMNSILELDTDNLVCVVEPGVVNDDLKAAVREHGLWYPPDPASAPWSTIGGNVATNAGGLCCVKYGVTRDYVLGMRAVVGGPLAYGDAIGLGRRTTKGVTGYDLTALMVGSEGTLGVITEVTLRLRPAVQGVPRTVVGAFSSLVGAGRAIAGVTRRGLTPSALELVDRPALQAVEDWKRLGLEPDEAVLLLGRVDTPGDAGAAEAAALREAYGDGEPLWAVESSDDAEAELLFQARRLVYPALERLGPVLTEDVCVPRSAVPQMLGRLDDIAARHGVSMATVAHAGDGNLHPLLIAPTGDDAARQATQAAFEEILDAALALGGTVTGEHGVGVLKREGMYRELDPGALAMQRAIKQAWDPLGIFNPGKAL